jgi:hypothetical protein
MHELHELPAHVLDIELPGDIELHERPGDAACAR